MLKQRPEGGLKNALRDLFDQRKKYLDSLCGSLSPAYIFEPEVLRRRAEAFQAAFLGRFSACGFYFAVKSNNYPLVAKTLIQSSFGLDVSGSAELALALRLGAEDIFFTGPGKTDEELRLAVKNHKKITVLIDSVHELKALQGLAEANKTSIRAGVRFNTKPFGPWGKFGIPLDRLDFFFRESERCAAVDLQGLQFHTSWNHTPRAQAEVIRLLGQKLKNCPPDVRARIKFLDVGGGYWPESGQWFLNGRRALYGPKARATVLPRRFYSSCPIGYFAERLSGVVRRHLGGLTGLRVCFEPGRWICQDSMHILMTVTDKKAHDLVITDAGINAIGWERFVKNYFPILNLSRPSLSEKACQIAGSLCCPDDVFGFSYFGSGIRAGDVLLIPWQGAYAYSLRQEFIKPAPRVLTARCRYAAKKGKRS